MGNVCPPDKGRGGANNSVTPATLTAPIQMHKVRTGYRVLKKTNTTPKDKEEGKIVSDDDLRGPGLRVQLLNYAELLYY